MRIAVVDRDSCDPKKCGQECIKYCPLNKGGKVVWLDENTGKAVISEKLCIGCGICVHKCPFSAITITNLPDELESDCVHRYFPGGFKLYRLPMLKRGTIVGIIGRNALGKTTIAKILAGELVPNLCKETGASHDDVIKAFRGTELQTYFSELYGKRMKTVHKIQYIELIPLYLKGTVRDIAEKAKIPQELMERLGLSKLADRDISNLSGGELQKLAIAAALSKDADVYIFDEPSTHLDVVERVRIAALMREKTQGKFAVVVEHDFTILDYLADTAVVLYGKPGAYGIVSHPLGAREAVNEYLSGYLAHENMRIRNEAIKFEVRPPERKTSRQRALAQWTDLSITLDTFRLRVKSGYIGRGEIVGVIGPNGVGKTTFVRMLVGELKPDEGEIFGVSAVSYKPQYIRQIAVKNSEVPVRLWLAKEAPEYSDNPIWPDISSGLGLSNVLDKTMGELSGGELQRVVVAASLLKKADLYVLDEPMAYLDVEQRIAVARTVRRIIEESESAALVVEHDVAMLDYMSSSIMPFLGASGVEGYSEGPLDMRTGMNIFLKWIDVTFRREPKTGRPRVNKPGSVLDREQKERGEYYYAT
ncbi:ribosome biogenesis/translation initiation ATPase RLI [Thermoproteus tenax]|uniref:Predicted ABC-class ATPase, RNase L inhibitor n=1 Tax=Thermoproteus tenax (strain ATCC 35583 / DSM 2078 / JCM 9277 / NBRC 100435 / Kra 1) TaxID=768679 RepID=G4RP72_THETK|nr:ribosome biogenesis/translation initiation ATPase RLI [Thermoproteus tenax]CCC81367.1 predicted ABC-class ATPase, RNase L inhibitor [Thermoproteus tenax Kra 1]